MDLDLEKLYYSFLAQRVPEMWEDAAYPSLKPLSSWVKDFLKRIKFIRKWLSEGPMSSYWISAFFFP